MSSRARRAPPGAPDTRPPWPDYQCASASAHRSRALTLRGHRRARPVGSAPRPNFACCGERGSARQRASTRCMFRGCHRAPPRTPSHTESYTALCGGPSPLARRAAHHRRSSFSRSHENSGLPSSWFTRLCACRWCKCIATQISHAQGAAGSLRGLAGGASGWR